LSGNVKILVVLDVSENNHVLIVDGLALVAVLVARLNYEDHKLTALGVEFDHVTRLVQVSAILAPLQERLAVIMIELDFVAVFNQLPLSAVLNFFIH
jgi:hypothetical protein